MKRIVTSLGAFTLILGLSAPISPAVAATENPTQTSGVDWLLGDVSNVAFGADGRLWAWNQMFTGANNTGLQLHVFDKDISGDWVHSYEFNPRKFDPRYIAFDSTNKMYATNFAKNEILVVTFKENGEPSKITRIPRSRSMAPYQAIPTSDGHVYVSAYGRIDEYRAPLTKRSKPIRTIKTDVDWNSSFTADGSGNVYAKDGPVQSGGLKVFTSGQEGRATPARTFTIDPSYTTGYISDVTFTDDGWLAVVYGDSGIAIFPTNESGSNQVPATWYPSAGGYRGVAFDPNGVMAVADYGAASSIKWFFETP